ncbi:Uma2 family endonuclease [Oscillatoria amoena NRMC-F 0135]|nr:Uma2 family endonuclease [Oscillatoria amoena NRMC-F 0135]
MVASPPIRIPHRLKVTDEQFWQLLNVNPDIRMERTAEGELIIMAPTGSESGSFNLELSTDLAIWNRQTSLGVAFDSSTGFHLPNGATRSPDSSWVTKERWNALTPEQRRGFAPICPDFVLELASLTDDIEELRAKMREYLENSSRLGWLIDLRTQQVEIYRISQSVEVLQSPATLSGEDVLPGFVLSLNVIFDSNPQDG